MADRVVLRGWKSICVVMDYEYGSWESAKETLTKLGILHYENRRPVVLLSDMDKYYFNRFKKK